MPVPYLPPTRYKLPGWLAAISGASNLVDALSSAILAHRESKAQEEERQARLEALRQTATIGQREEERRQGEYEFEYGMPLARETEYAHAPRLTPEGTFETEPEVGHGYERYPSRAAYKSDLGMRTAEATLAKLLRPPTEDPTEQYRIMKLMQDVGIVPKPEPVLSPSAQISQKTLDWINEPGHGLEEYWNRTRPEMVGGVSGEWLTKSQLDEADRGMEKLRQAKAELIGISTRVPEDQRGQHPGFSGKAAEVEQLEHYVESKLPDYPSLLNIEFVAAIADGDYERAEEIYYQAIDQATYPQTKSYIQLIWGDALP